MELLLIKSQQVLVPGRDEDAEWLVKKKQGATILGEFHEMRNGAFFRKWWSLVKYAFDIWSETCEPLEYKGQPVIPNFDRFRKDVTILAGFRIPVWNIRGDLRVEAESLKWSKMSEERFAALYAATLQALTQAVFNGKRCQQYSVQQLNEIHDRIWSYADNWSAVA
jgi:hypothetical protein